jgi:hypothetical protein
MLTALTQTIRRVPGRVNAEPEAGSSGYIGLKIQSAFSPEGRAGARMIRMRRTENAVCTVSTVREHGHQVRTTSGATAL